MSQEKAFLKSISDSSDRTPRLVYADWLEEHGDPRAELIRVEEEMRQVPIYSDRYWQLKPQRNKLRDRTDKKWLQAMKYGTDYEPVFHEIPAGWKERWRLLREFTERWHGFPMPDVGGRAKEVHQAEKKLGLNLPPSVREWIAFGVDLEKKGWFGHVLRDCYEVKDLTELSAVSLMIQGEGDFYYAVKKDNLKDADPPVHGYVLDWENEGENRFVDHRQEPFVSHVASFVLGHMSFYLHGAGGGFGTSVESTAKLQQQLTGEFPVQAEFDHLRVFEATNMIILLGSCPDGGNEPHLTVEIRRKLPRNQLPAFLLEYTRGGGYFHGMFTPNQST
jgi:uncharacterized protein (TIGR02996 family)